MLSIADQRAGSRSRAFTVSVAFHGVVIALLLAIRFVPVVEQRTPVHVTLIALPRELPAPPKIHVPPTRLVARVARETKIALAVPAALEIHRLPEPIPEVPIVASPPEKPIAVAEPLPPVPERARPTSTGWFDSTPVVAAIPTRAVSHSSGFADVTAAPVESVRPSVTNAAFGDSTVAARMSVSREAAPAAPTSPIEILFKPRPVYSEEGRRLRVEGEVQIEMIFEASGSLEVVRVIRGLGRGLDESAIGAARGIRFRPAQRGGRPVDSTAIVHIVFQLAY